MSDIKKEILASLDETFDYEATRWVPSFELLFRLKQHGLRLDLDDLIRELQRLATTGLVEFSPTEVGCQVRGFTTRLSTSGYNQLHFNRSSLTR